MVAEMAEKVFGLSVNQVMAYAAVANIVLVVVLAAINIYYARHAKRQADASAGQVNASNRQAEIAQATLHILQERAERQSRIDLATVRLQIETALELVEDWKKRIGSDAYPQLPGEIEILPADFGVAIQYAERVGHTVAGYMRAATLYVAKAATNIRVIGAASATDVQHWKAAQEQANYNLKIARQKLQTAREHAAAADAVKDASAKAKESPAS